MNFDYDNLLTYYNTRNYAGAIDYINKFNYEGNDAVIMRKELDKLRRAKSIEETTVKNLAGEDSEAYNFFRSLSGNYIDRTRKGKYADGQEFSTTNKYGDEYLRNITNLQAKDGNSITDIAIDIDDKDALDRLQKEIGEKGLSFSDLKASVVPIANGKYRIISSKNNTQLYKLINTVNHLNGIDNQEAIAWGGGAGGIIGGILGAIPSLGLGTVPTAVGGAALGSSIAGTISNLVNDYNIKGLSDGKVYDSSDFNIDNLTNAVKIINKAEDKYNDIQSRLGQLENEASEISVSGYMSLGHKKAAELKAKGLISPSQYDSIVEEWQNYITNIVSGASFADKDVYVLANNDAITDEGKLQKGVVLNQIHNTDSENAKIEILNAIKEKRCTYQMATRDGQLGTMFTITPDEDKNNKVSDKYANRLNYIFVEGMFDEALNEEFEKDTKTRAARTNADMKKLSYEKELADGSIVGYKNGVPYKKQYNTKTTKYTDVSISEEDILSGLNESENINDGVNYILSNYNKNKKSIAINDGNEVKYYGLLDALNLLATNTVNECYPSSIFSEYDRTRKKAEIIYLSKQMINKYNVR